MRIIKKLIPPLKLSSKGGVISVMVLGVYLVWNISKQTGVAESGSGSSDQDLVIKLLNRVGWERDVNCSNLQQRHKPTLQYSRMDYLRRNYSMISITGPFAART